MHKTKCHDSRHDDVLRNGLGHVDVHDMVDDYGFAGHHDKQKSALLIEPKLCICLHTSQSTAYCMWKVVPYREFSDRRGRQISRCIYTTLPVSSSHIACSTPRSTFCTVNVEWENVSSICSNVDLSQSFGVRA